MKGWSHLASSAWLIVGQFGNAILGLVTLRVLTEFMGIAEYGVLALLVGIGLLVQQVSTTPLMQVVQRRYADEFEAFNLRPLLGSSLLSAALCLTITFTSLLIILNLLPIRMSGSATIGTVPLLLMLFALFEMLRSVAFAWVAAQEAHKSLAILTLVDGVQRPLFAVIAISVFGAHAELAIGAFSLSSAIVAVAGLTLVRSGVEAHLHAHRHSHYFSNATYANGIDLIKSASVLFPAAFLGWVVGLGNRYVVAGGLTVEDVGLLAAITALVSRPFLIVGTLVELQVRPKFYSAIASNRPKTSAKIFVWWVVGLLSIAAVGSLCVFFLHQILARVFLGDAFHESSILMVPIALGFSILIVAQVFDRVSYAAESFKNILYVQLIGAVAIIGISIGAIHGYGVTGAFWAVPVGTGVMLAASVYFAASVRHKLKWS